MSNGEWWRCWPFGLSITDLNIEHPYFYRLASYIKPEYHVKINKATLDFETFNDIFNLMGGQLGTEDN